MGLIRNARILWALSPKMDAVLGAVQKGDMTKILPSILALGGAAASIFSAPIQGFIMAHPALAGALTSLYALLTHWLPSPATPGEPK